MARGPWLGSAVPSISCSLFRTRLWSAVKSICGPSGMLASATRSARLRPPTNRRADSNAALPRPGPMLDSIDDQHDQTAADRLDIRRIVRRSGDGQLIGAAADRHELSGDNLTAPAVDAHLEIGGGQVADRLALSVDHVDVHSNQIE